MSWDGALAGNLHSADNFPEADGGFAYDDSRPATEASTSATQGGRVLFATPTYSEDAALMEHAVRTTGRLDPGHSTCRFSNLTPLSFTPSPSSLSVKS